MRPAPPLEPTFASVNRFIAHIAAEVAAGRLDRTDGKELNQVARSMLLSIRTEHGQRELEEMRELVKQARAAHAEGERVAVERRYGSAVLTPAAKSPIK